MPSRIQTIAVSRFTCLGAACEDTCCKGWGMQLTRETMDKFAAEAPELLAAVSSGEAEFVMKRDPETDYCVKFDTGWCGIHRDYGSDFLGDACHFFPRITRSVGETVITTAALSCPESARLMLMEADAFVATPREEVRTPFSLKQYLPQQLTEVEALALHGLFVAEAGNAEFTAEENVMRLSAVMQALGVQPLIQWPQAAPFYFKMAAGRMPAAEAIAVDPFNLTHALHGLVAASTGNHRPRLMQTIATMKEMLGISFTDSGINLTPDAAQKYLLLYHHWKSVGATLQTVLRRYLQAQVSMAFFPFAGLGMTLGERMTVIGVRFATMKLGLMAEAKKENNIPPESTVIRVVQSLSRYLDHLADPTLSLQIYHEAGWVREPRLRALLME